MDIIGVKTVMMRTLEIAWLMILENNYEEKSSILDQIRSYQSDEKNEEQSEKKN